MMIHNSCPRCHGTLITDQDEFACLQCGARVYDIVEPGRASSKIPRSMATPQRAA